MGVGLRALLSFVYLFPFRILWLFVLEKVGLEVFNYCAGEEGKEGWGLIDGADSRVDGKPQECGPYRVEVCLDFSIPFERTHACSIVVQDSERPPYRTYLNRTEAPFRSIISMCPQSYNPPFTQSCRYPRHP